MSPLRAQAYMRTRDLLQQQVADVVTGGNVDVLEPVEVDEHQGERLALAPRVDQALFEAVVEQQVQVGRHGWTDRAWRGS